MDKPECELIGGDGNVFAIMGAVRRAKEGWVTIYLTQHAVAAMLSLARGGV